MRSERLERFVQEFGLVEEHLAARNLVEFDEAASLVVAAVDAGGREHRLTEETAAAWQSMQRAASEEGVSLFIISAFRSVDRQAELIRRKLAAGQSLEQVLAVSALPGCSEHHTGRAVDVGTHGCPLLEQEFDATPAFLWLKRHAREFGFRLSYPPGNSLGYVYEPWHWFYGDA
jgi:zinc D-Ala-D-Ala carboxypeptidase